MNGIDNSLTVLDWTFQLLVFSSFTGVGWTKACNFMVHDSIFLVIIAVTQLNFFDIFNKNI